MRDVHGGEASLPDPCGAAGVVAEAVHALEQTGAEVEALPVLKQVGGSGVDGEPLLAVDAEGHREPVRQVDEALVVDGLALHLVDQPVEDAGGVGAGIVDAVGASFGGAATGGEIAVADRAQGLAQPLLGGIVAVVDDRPGIGCAYGCRNVTHEAKSRGIGDERGADRGIHASQAPIAVPWSSP